MTDAKSLIRLIKFVCNSLRNIEIAVSAEGKQIETKVRKIKSQISDLNFAVENAERTPTWIRKLGLGSTWRHFNTKTLESLRHQLVAQEGTLWKHQRILNDRRTAKRHVNQILNELSDALTEILSFQSLPPTLIDTASSLEKELARLKTKASRSREEVTSLAEAGLKAAKSWILLERINLHNKPIQKQSTFHLPPPRYAHSQIWLPLPTSMWKTLEDAGIPRNHGVKNAGQFYLPEGTELKPYDRFLPLSYRQRPPNFVFNPRAPVSAMSLNIWNAFDNGTWDHIRQINSSRSGRRCVLCGNVNHRLMEIDNGPKWRKGAIDCHEIWDWHQPDPDIKVGIQTLKSIIVVCFECHMAFHEGYARKLARAKGLESEFKSHIASHRVFMTRRDPRDIKNEMNTELLRLKQFDDVHMWIVDLGHLEKQDYMKNVNMIFNEDNSAGISPHQIAGVHFISSSGETWESRSAAEIYENVAPAYQQISAIDFMRRI